MNLTQSFSLPFSFPDNNFTFGDNNDAFIPLTDLPSQHEDVIESVPYSGGETANLPQDRPGGGLWALNSRIFLNNEFEYDDDEEAFRYDDFDDDFDEDFEELPDDEFEDFPDPYEDEEEEAECEGELTPDDLEEVDPFDDDFDDLNSDENTFVDDDSDDV